MKSSKFYRLSLGLIILFSIILFQGAESESCGDSDSCANDINISLGYVSIYNHTIFDLQVHFWGSAGSDNTIVFNVKAGQVGLRVSLEPKLYGAFAYKMINGVKFSTKASNYQYILVKEGSNTNYHVY